jgi:hypothetical protein
MTSEQEYRHFNVVILSANERRKDESKGLRLLFRFSATQIR